MKRLDYLMVGAVVLIYAAIMLVVLPKKGHAHDPQTHQADGLADAKSEAYGVCCNGDDYTRIRVEEWETTDTGWRIRWHGKWFDAPRKAKVSNMPNPDGEAKVWINGTEDNLYVRCFMPGAQS